MDFATQTRLKLRVAIVSVNNSTAHHLDRVVGVKRQAGAVLVPVMKQFLLLTPLDSTFADLKSLTRAQYEKLYKSQTGYLPLKNILLFQDSNQCDLDEDYLVADICASNDLVYAVVEVDDQSNKKIKISNSPNNPGNPNNQKPQTQNQNQQQKPKQQPQAPNSSKAQNEKMVPEFKPTFIKPPTPQNNANIVIESKIVEAKVIEVKKQSEIKAPEPKRPEIKVSKSNKDETKVSDPAEDEVQVSSHAKDEAQVNAPSKEVPEVKLTEIVKSDPEIKVTEPEQSELNGIADPEILPQPVKIHSEVSPATLVKERPLKAQPKKIQKPEARRKEQNPQQEHVQLQAKTETIEVIEPVKVTEPVVTKNADLPEMNAPEVESDGSERSQNIITPGPTPTPISRPTSSTPIFHPRKSSSQELASSSSEDSDEEAESTLKHFDACNLFGSQVIASEPRRSDAFVLFAAGSSSEDEDSSENEDVIVRTVSPPTKSSSIVSLQAGPSSEVEGSSSDESVVNESIDKNDCVLPQSVTLRRLSSVSPIPDPSEIPSLDELKESLCRAPTPIQILAEQKQSLGKSPKTKQKFYYHHNNQDNSNKRGRPAKKQAAGRPKK